MDCVTPTCSAFREAAGGANRWRSFIEGFRVGDILAPLSEVTTMVMATEGSDLNVAVRRRRPGPCRRRIRCRTRRGTRQRNYRDRSRVRRMSTGTRHESRNSPPIRVS